MSKWMGNAVVAALLLTGFVAVSRAVEVPTEEWERMKQQMAELQARGGSVPAEPSAVDTALDSKYGPGATVTTNTGKLTIGGLLQVWYVNYEKDTRGLFDDPAVSGVRDSNAANNNNTFRIRHAEVKFAADINEQISGFVQIDPAAEATGFPGLPTGFGLLKTNNALSNDFILANGANGNGAPIAALQNNGVFPASAPQLLQDAYINWHNCLPYHDVQIGQFKPWIGEEGIRNDGQLDFVERSMVGQFADSRDIGMSVHGSFWGKDCFDRDGRFQYWGGVFNGSGSYFNPNTSANRADVNQSKDWNARMLVRPLWSECEGNLEIGGSFEGGMHGATSSHGLGQYDPIVAPQDGVNRPDAWASRYNAWLSYKAPQMFKGLWVRGEWTWIKDTNNPDSNIDFTGSGGGANANLQDWGRATSIQGLYGSLGYRFGDSCWAQSGMPCFLKNVELAGRYEQFQDVMEGNSTDAALIKVNRFYTKVWTAGINYYVAGNNAKVQGNFNHVIDPMDHQNAARVFHRVAQDNFALNFQVAF